MKISILLLSITVLLNSYSEIEKRKLPKGKFYKNSGRMTDTIVFNLILPIHKLLDGHNFFGQ